jgi:outer membrane protein TolC
MMRHTNRPRFALIALAAALLLWGGVAGGQGKPSKPGQPPPEHDPATGETPPPAAEPGTLATAVGPPTTLEPPGPPSVDELGFELPQVTPGEPMTLDQALVRADRRNLGLQSARIEIEKAEARLEAAWGGVLPIAQASLQMMHRDHADTVNFTDSLPPGSVPEGMGGDMVVMPQQDLKGNVQVLMPLVNAQNWLTIGVAKQGVRLTESTIEEAQQQVLLGVAVSYFVASQFGDLIELNHQQVRSAAHHLRIARARYEAGTGLKIDVIRAETDLAKSRQELLSSHLAYDNARDALGTLAGAEGLPLPVGRPTLAEPAGGEEQLVSQALAERPSIQAQQQAVELADRALDAAWMQFLPTLNAVWNLDYQFTEPGDLGSTDRSRWAFIFTLSVPIYNHYRYGDLDLKRAELKQAMLNQEDTQNNLSHEVRQLRRDYLNALSSVAIAERQTDLAAEGLALVEAAYEVGTGTSLDVTDARRTKAAADFNLIRTQLEAQIALLTLLQAVGADMAGLSG